MIDQCANCASVEEGERCRQDRGLVVSGGGFGRDEDFVENVEACGSEGEKNGDEAQDLFQGNMLALEIKPEDAFSRGAFLDCRYTYAMCRPHMASGASRQGAKDEYQ